MKKLYLLIILSALYHLLLAADNPLKQIECFAAEQPQPVSAFDVEKQFDVLTGIPFDPEGVFNVNPSSQNTVLDTYVAITALSATHFVVVYLDGSNSDRGVAKVGEISGASVSYGPEAVFNVAATTNLSVSALSSTHFVVAYSDMGNTDHGTAIVGEVSGTAISYGAETVFNAAVTNTLAISALSSTHFVATYSDAGNANRGTAIVGEVSGTSISYGTESVFNTTHTNWISVDALSSSHFVLTYSDVGNFDRGTARVGEISGTSISYGAENVFFTNTTNGTSVAALSSSHFVVVFHGQGLFTTGYAIIGMVTGTTISSFGPQNIFNSGTTAFLSVTALSPTHFVVAYRDTDNSFRGTARIGKVSGTSITYVSGECVFNSDLTSFISVVALDNTNFVVVYRDVGNSSHDTAIIGDASTLVPVEYTYLEGKVEAKSIQLWWQTASEFNNNGFGVEHSTDGKTWKRLVFVKGNATTVEIQNYTYEHQEPAKGTNYYRLKQVDFDESFEYSDVVAIDFDFEREKEELIIYPNPVLQVLRYNVTDSEAIQSVELFDLYGRLVKSPSRINGILSLDGVFRGTYLLIVSTNRTTLQKLVIKE